MCKRIMITVMCLLAISLAGCNRGDFKASLIVEGQPAPHPGYNIGPDIYLEQGDAAKVSGAVIWIKGLGPNDLLGNTD